MQDQHPGRLQWIIETINDIIVFSNVYMMLDDSVGPDPRAVVLILTSVFLHVKISVKVFRVYLGMVTSFWSTFVLEGVM